MSAAALLERLSRDGVSVECVADRLKIHAPRDLKPQILDAIRCHKSELLELLQLESASTRCEPESEPIAPALPVEELPAYVNDFTEARQFLRAVRSVKVPPSLRLTACAARHYRHVAACLACGIDPQGRERDPPSLE